MPDEPQNQIQESPGNWGQSQGLGFWSKYKLAIIIGIVVLIVVAFGSWLLFRKDQQSTVSPVDWRERAQPAPVDLKGILSLAPRQLNLEVGEEFSVEVLMNTDNYNISAASAILEYDQQQLEAVKIDTSQSVLSLSVEKKIEGGKVRIARGQPADSDYEDQDDGYTGRHGLLAQVVFKTKAVGEGQINFVNPDSKLILDDGHGTDMQMILENATYIIK